MKTKVNLVKMADHRHVALTKPIGIKSVVWECFGIPVFLRGNGLRSTDKTKVYCFVLNLINVKYSFTSIYWKVKYCDTHQCHVSWQVSDRLGTVSSHPYNKGLKFDLFWFLHHCKQQFWVPKFPQTYGLIF